MYHSHTIANTGRWSEWLIIYLEPAKAVLFARFRSFHFFYTRARVHSIQVYLCENKKN